MACVFGSPAASCPQTEIHSDYLVKSVHRSKSKWGDVFFSLSLEVNRPYLLRINWPEYPRWSSSEDVPLIDQAKAPSPPPTAQLPCGECETCWWWWCCHQFSKMNLSFGKEPITSFSVRLHASAWNVLAASNCYLGGLHGLQVRDNSFIWLDSEPVLEKPTTSKTRMRSKYQNISIALIQESAAAAAAACWVSKVYLLIIVILLLMGVHAAKVKLPEVSLPGWAFG